jgi:hypothetical protein
MGRRQTAWANRAFAFALASAVADELAPRGEGEIPAPHHDDPEDMTAQYVFVAFRSGKGRFRDRAVLKANDDCVDYIAERVEFPRGPGCVDRFSSVARPAQRQDTERQDN